MRAIHKNAEPPSLTEHRCKAHADYDNYSDKDTLRASLVAEQRGLCCYCLSRIRPTSDDMKIEHWHSQTEFPGEQLDYSNLLGACLGNEGQPPRDQHCDTRKENARLSKNPALPVHVIDQLIHFSGDGRVWSSNETLDRELNDVLNLNTKFLENNRKAVLDGFKRLIGRGSNFQALLAEWAGDSHSGELREHCQVVVYWLRKKLRRSA